MMPGTIFVILHTFEKRNDTILKKCLYELKEQEKDMENRSAIFDWRLNVAKAEYDSAAKAYNEAVAAADQSNADLKQTRTTYTTMKSM